MRQTLLAALLLLTSPLCRLALGQESMDLSLLERFALAPDRAALLEKWVLPAADSFFLRCLERQQAGDLEASARLLDTWRRQGGEEDPRFQELAHRQALLDVERDPSGSYAYLIRALGLSFDDRPPRVVGGRDLPTVLDPEAISFESFLDEALSQRRLSGLEDWLLAEIASQPLDPARLRAWLARLDRPEVPGLVERIAADLKRPSSDGFGSLPIHGLLLKAELDALLELQPELLDQVEFVRAYLRRLAPGADEPWREEAALRAAYLDRLEAFAKRLAPRHAPLLATILSHRLAFDLEQGRPSRKRFLEWLSVRRGIAAGGGRKGREASGWKKWLARELPLGETPAEASLQEAYLETFFRQGDEVGLFAPYLPREELNRKRAETNLLYGIGYPEQWVAELASPEAFERLRSRVELRFPAGAQRHFAADDAVAIEVDLKNVSSLLVKVYTLDAFAWYRREGRELDTNISLGGLVAGAERSFSYEVDPLRRIRRHFEFPELEGPGVYLVEFIGGGRSSRVLVRKGALTIDQRIGPSAQEVTVRDETGRLRRDAHAWLGSHEYRADEEGILRLPFSTEPGPTTLIVSAGKRCSLVPFEQQAEEYRLEAPIWIEREGLRSGAEATLLFRPRLWLADGPIPLSRLTQARLEISATRLDGTGVHLDRELGELDDEGSWHATFRVPRFVRSIEARMVATLQPLGGGEAIELRSEPRRIEINGIDGTPLCASPYLTREGHGWRLEVRGKNGEGRPGEVLTLAFHRRGFTRPKRVELRTDREGAVHLGPLRGIDRLGATLLGRSDWSWNLAPPPAPLPAIVNGVAGSELRLAWRPPEGIKGSVSLVELAGGAPLRSVDERVRLEDGYVVLAGLEGGDYDLYLPDRAGAIRIQVSAGPREQGWVRGRTRRLELSEEAPLQVTGLATEGDELVIHLGGSGQGTRVHVIAERFLPDRDPAADLWLSPSRRTRRVPRIAPTSEYAADRQLPAEYRYVLERSQARIFPGNMLPAPGLILNPWAPPPSRSRDLGGPSAPGPSREELGGGAGGRYAGRARGSRKVPSLAPLAFANLDFLARDAVVLTDLSPSGGELHLPLERLGEGSCITVLALDGDALAEARLYLPPKGISLSDQRLSASLPVEQHYVERRAVEWVPPGGSLALEKEGELEVFTSLEDIYRYYRAFDASGELARFAFLLHWPTLEPSAQRDLYGRFACHELDLFLKHRDSAFFEEVVRPHLENKRDKDFVDEWLLDRDLRSYLEPWAFGRLNPFEQALLARSREEEGTAIARHLSAEVALHPTPPALVAQRFQGVLGSTALQRAKAAEVILRDADEVEEEDEEAPRRKILAQPELPQGLFQPMGHTRAYLERGYWKRLAGESFLEFNEFWRDFAAADPARPFTSKNFALATGSSNEMLLALALLDLPFEGAAYRVEDDPAREGRRLLAEGGLVAVRRQWEAVAPSEGESGVLIGEQIVPAGKGEALDAALGAVEVGRAYLRRIVISNPTPKERDLELFLEIPPRSLPVSTTLPRRSLPLHVGAFGVEVVQAGFYFPAPAEVTPYPVQVTEGGALVAFTSPRTLVAEEPKGRQPSTFAALCASGTDGDLIAYLEKAELESLDLSLLAWRLGNRSLFERVIDLLRSRFVYDHHLWSYALLHRDARASGEYLRHCTTFLDQAGPSLSSPLLEIDPVRRLRYQEIEFRPLVHPRSHPFGGRRAFDNDQVRRHYRSLIEILARKPRLGDRDWLAVTYQMLLQGRVAAAIDALGHVDRDGVEARLQYDYLRAYLALYQSDLAGAADIAEAYADYPLQPWRGRFAEIRRQLAQISRGGDAPAESSAPALELEETASGLAIEHSGLGTCELRYYPLDIEYLFSESPFSVGEDEAAVYVEPVRVQPLALDPAGGRLEIALPVGLEHGSLWIEARGDGLVRHLVRQGTGLAVRIFESDGELTVRRALDGTPVAAAYVKVYSKDDQGHVRFHKDGYTDLRGRFDYMSVSGSEASRPKRLALLVLTPEEGAVIREVAPPAR